MDCFVALLLAMTRTEETTLLDHENRVRDDPREFEEWMGIVNDASRASPLRAVVRALANAGASAGMGLSVEGEKIRFFHRWNLIAARKRR